MSRKIVIVPCSGIGKPYGSVAREAAFVLVEDLRPAATRVVALSKLVLGDEKARETIGAAPAITIDGCARVCAATMVQQSGGTVVREIKVLVAHREHRELKPGGIVELNEAGQELARVIALDAAGTVDELVKGAAAPEQKGDRDA